MISVLSSFNSRKLWAKQSLISWRQFCNGVRSARYLCCTVCETSSRDFIHSFFFLSLFLFLFFLCTPASYVSALPKMWFRWPVKWFTSAVLISLVSFALDLINFPMPVQKSNLQLCKKECFCFNTEILKLSWFCSVSLNSSSSPTYDTTNGRNWHVLLNL